jgi:voltage-gated potassium channel
VIESLSARRVAYAVAALLAVLVGGTVAFHESLHETWMQSTYRTVVTISLAGLDTVPSNDWARLVSIVLVLAGLTIFAYIATVLVEGIARGVFTGAFAERRRRRTIEQLSDHYIICGYGRVGRRIAAEFLEEGVRFVVLDFSPEALEAARERNVLYVDGSGTEDEDLEAAGLERATGLVASSDSDADNLYITLSARNARPDLLIVARASDEDAAKKLRLAGADRVVQPYSTAGKEMAKLVLRPQVAAFLDIVSTSGGPELLFEEIEVQESCPRGREVDPRAAHPPADRRDDRRAAQGRRHLRHHARAGRRPRHRRRDDRRRHARGAGPPRGALRPDRSNCLTPSHASRPGCRSSRARRSSWSGRTIPRTATTRPTWRCGSRPCSAARRASSGKSSRSLRPVWTRSSARRSRGRASSTSG